MEYIKEKFEEIFGKEFGVLGEYKLKKETYNNQYLLTVAKFDQLIKVLPLITPYLVMKKKQAVLVLEFVNSRILKMNKKHIGSDISQREIEIYDDLKKLNKRGNNYARRYHS